MSNKQLEKMLIDIAKQFPDVQAISLGRDPEERFPVYYFLTNKYNPDLTTRLFEFESDIYDEGFSVSARQFRYTIQEPFLGERIWKRS